MAEKKSIYEEALLDAKKIQEALNANTKEILRSVAREEIDGMVKESLQESDYDEETVDDETETPESDDSGEETSNAGSESGSEEGGDEVEVGGEESDDSEIPSSDEVGDDQEEPSMDADAALGGDELDMTSSSDDDVIAIYKKLSGEDEIEIVGDEVHMNITEPGEYIVKKGALDSAVGGGEDMAPEMGGDEFGGEDDMGGTEEIGGTDGIGDEWEEEITYEIAMDDADTISESEDSDEEEISETKDIESVTAPTVTETKDIESVTAPTVTEEDVNEDEDQIEEKISVGTGMSVGTHRGNGPKSIGAGENPKSKNESVASKKVITETEIKYKKLLSEAAQLKTENEEFRQALKKFRGMLIETVVFNSNLSYVTKLFMEHSTTKEEKSKIIKRFDEEVSNLKESKKLYKTIVSELSSRKPMNESVESRIIKEVTTSGSKQLNESTAYVDPSTQRIRDLINRVEKR